MQHVRDHLLAADAKKISGVKTMEEVWQRLERVYRDRELNILTVKSNLESFSLKSALDLILRIIVSYRRSMRLWREL